MLRQIATLIGSLLGEAVDIDVDDDGNWVAICREDRKFVLATPAACFDAPGSVRFPIVRWLGCDRIALIDSRAMPPRPNAFVFTPAGDEIRRFFAGDGIADVLVSRDKIVVTYFDEGVFGKDQTGAEGLCVFSPEGGLECGYRSRIENPVDIADCYCACIASPHEVSFFPYTSSGFPLVRLNLETLEQHVFDVPEKLAGASALATDGVEFYFYSPYEARKCLYRWKPGDTPAKIGAHPGPLRGHRSVSFLSVGTSGYTVVFPEPA